MTEKKLKPAAKTAATSKTSARKSGAVSSKSETTKATAATASKKTVAQKSAPTKTAPKKAAVSATKKTDAVAMKKAATPAAGRKTPNVPVAKAATFGVGHAPSARTIANPTPEERYRMVETAAYFIAEQNGFQGRSEEHWLAAEREIAARLGC